MAISAAVGVAAVGTAVSAISSQNAANAQAGSAANALSAQQSQRTQAFAAAQPSFGQMQQIQQQYMASSNLLNTQLTQLQSQYQLYQSASSQAQALMNGQAASTLAPMQQQQQLQRQQLQQSLEQQYGPGYASSTAGSMALANFDMQSQYATSQAQMQATGTFLNASQALGGQYTQGLNSAYATSANIRESGISASNQLQTLGVQALNGNQPNYTPSIQTAGSGSVGMGQFGAGMTSIAGNALGRMAGSSSAPNTYTGVNTSNDSAGFTMPQIGAPAAGGNNASQ